MDGEQGAGEWGSLLGDEAKAQELSIPVVGAAGDMFLWHMGTLHRSGANVMPPGTPPRVAFNSEHSDGLSVTTLSSHLVVAGGFSARWFNNCEKLVPA